MTTALVIDDEPAICWGFQSLLQGVDVAVRVAGTGAAGLALARQQSFDLILLDVRLPDANGLELIGPLRQLAPQASIIVMTAHGELETAVSAIKQGAVDYLHKPFRLGDALEACQRAIQLQQRALAQPPGLSAESPPAPAWPTAQGQLIGQSTAMQKLFHQIALVANSDLSVLITGETGTGKELVAEAIVRHSARRDQPFVAIAPVAYNPALLESELFGHAKGAFTGANEERKGVFEVAHGGTILLDEIGDLPLNAQVKLLRVLEQKSFSRVGETTNRPCDVRILAATHTPLAEAVAEGRFREDLMYRLGAVVLELPPLRDRLEDVEPLLRHFLRSAGYDERRGVDPKIVAHLQQQPWPGNVRELKNLVHRAVVVARGRALDVGDFHVQHWQAPTVGQSELAMAVHAWVRNALASEPDGEAAASGAGRGLPLYDQFLSVTEPVLFRAVLEALSGNRTAAADVLGMHRATLRERLTRYGID